MKKTLVQFVVQITLLALWVVLYFFPALICAWFVIVKLKFHFLFTFPILGIIFVGVVADFINRNLGFPQDLDLFRSQSKVRKWLDSLGD